jgi:predicted Zn-dependent peptidase
VRPPDPNVEQTTLASGLRIVTETMMEARSVSLGAWVAVGARDEADALSGASHFLEHLLFKGTADRSAKQLAEAIDSVGGEMNAFTAQELTAYYALLPHQQMALGIGILGAVLTDPALREPDVESERQVIVEEILMNLDSPEDRAHALLSRALFGEHPLGREVLGEIATVEALGRDDIAGFFDRWYRPTSMVIAAAGHLEHAEVVAAVSAAFGEGSPGDRPERRPPGPVEAVVEVEHDDTEQAHLCLGWRSRSLHDDDADRWPLAVANQVLGGGMASRLFQEVREERGLAYAVQSSTSAYGDTGCLTIYCGTGPKRARETLHVIDDVVASLAGDGITDAELAVAAGYLEGSLLLGLDDSAGRMSRLGRSLVHWDRTIGVDELLAGIRAVTTEDVHRVLRQVFEAPRVLTAVGPFDADALA